MLRPARKGERERPGAALFKPLRQVIESINETFKGQLDRALHAYLRWRNANGRHPDILAAQRRERARIRSEKGIRWGGRPVLETVA